MRNLILIVLVVFGAAASADMAGSLNFNDGGGLDGSGVWSGDVIRSQWQASWFPGYIDWEVSNNQDGTWRYTYEFTVSTGDISHFILETGTDLLDWPFAMISGDAGHYSVGEYGPGGSNPYIPDSIYGIKFEGEAGTTMMISFDSGLMPGWGSFYAKGGSPGGDWATAWNDGFGEFAPPWGDESGASAWIAVPMSPVPVQGTLMLLLTGIGCFAAYRFTGRQRRTASC